MATAMGPSSSGLLPADVDNKDFKKQLSKTAQAELEYVQMYAAAVISSRTFAELLSRLVGEQREFHERNRSEETSTIGHDRQNTHGADEVVGSRNKGVSGWIRLCAHSTTVSVRSTMSGIVVGESKVYPTSIANVPIIITAIPVTNPQR